MASAFVDLLRSITYLTQMAMRDIVILPDPRLKLVSDPVARVDDDTLKLLDDMLETMYDAPGIGLAANLVMLLGLMSMFEATLTVPGIAGLVLTVGMAVDANVIIFERIREELRTGRAPRAAVAAGFQKARSAILDANITTLMTAIILFQYGSGPIKGL